MTQKEKLVQRILSGTSDANIPFDDDHSEEPADKYIRDYDQFVSMTTPLLK